MKILRTGSPASWQTSPTKCTRETQQKLLALVDNSIELMSILENNQRNSYINKAGMEMLGFDSLQQVWRDAYSDPYTPEDVALHKPTLSLPYLVQEKWSGIMNAGVT